MGNCLTSAGAPIAFTPNFYQQTYAPLSLPANKVYRFRMQVSKGGQPS